MKTILQEQRRSSVIVALITMVLGAVLVVWPDRSVRLMCTLLGAALLICGLVYILGWLVRRREGGISAFTLIPGVVLSGLGIWLMTGSDSVIALVQYVFGAVVIFHGVLDVQSFDLDAALSLKNNHFHHQIGATYYASHMIARRWISWTLWSSLHWKSTRISTSTC